MENVRSIIEKESNLEVSNKSKILRGIYLMRRCRIMRDVYITGIRRGKSGSEKMHMKPMI